MQIRANKEEPELSQSTKSPLNEDFSKLVDQTLDLWKVPGIAIAVVDGPHITHKGYGLRDIGAGDPVTPYTNFYAGSTTKAFTAAGLGLLIEENEDVQWTTPVHELIRDDFVVADPWATDHLTLEDVLSHRTGLPHHDQSHGRTPSKDTPHDAPRPAVREMVRRIRYLPLTAEPRTTFQYCNIMFIAAAHVIEQKTGQWLGKWLKDRIWEPLGMHGTYFDTDDARAAIQPLATGYRYDEQVEEYVKVPWMDLDGTSGAGAVISNVADYARWAQAVMAQGPPLAKKTWEALTSARSIVASRSEPATGSMTYALGWFGGVYKDQRYWEHAGAMNAFGAELIIFPDLEFAVIAFANTAGSSVIAAQALLWKLIDDKIGVPEVERFNWNQRNKDNLKNGIANARNARSRLFPSLPDPPLARTLSLSAYAGTYYDPGYQTLRIDLSDAPVSSFLSSFLDPDRLPATCSKPASSTTQSNLPQQKKHLVAGRTTTTWPEHLTFMHVSGDFFLAWAEHDGDFGAWYPDAYPVEFRIGADGRVAEVGMGWEEHMREKGEKIWLKRVEEAEADGKGT